MAPRQKTESSVYKQLAALDSGIADRWWDASKGDQGYVDIKGEELIIDPIMKSKKVTTKQAEAIKILYASGHLDDVAILALKLDMNTARKFLPRKRLQEKKTPLEWGRVIAALSMANVAKIAFISPGSNFFYIPFYFSVIKELVRSGDISVWDSEVDGLPELVGELGTYDTDSNFLILYPEATGIVEQSTIVHEATHAIQDWLDVVLLTKHAEADAYICGAVVERVKGHKTSNEIICNAAYEAAQYVMDGTCKLNNTKWTEAYGAVVSEIEQDNQYRQRANHIFTTKKAGEGDSESQRFSKILKDITRRFILAR